MDFDWFYFRHHHPSILANLISRPDTVHQSIELFANQVNPKSECADYLKQSFCSIEAFILPWYAVQRRLDPTDASSSQQKAKIEHARRSHEYLVSVLSNDVSDTVCLHEKNLRQLCSVHRPNLGPVSGKPRKLYLSENSTFKACSCKIIRFLDSKRCNSVSFV